jgi:hypothetical protein
MNVSIARVLRNPKFQVAITIERPEEGEFVGSEFVRGSDPTTATIKAVVHPLTRLALKTTFPYEQSHVLPEGVRTESSIILYTFAELRTTQGQQPGDRVIGYHGDDWEVLSVERWDDYGFYVAIAAAVPRGLAQ